MVATTLAHPESESLAANSSGVPELRPGEVLAGKYLLLRHLGLGGMGQVWLARNSATGAEVAAKVLLPERAASADALTRFRREAHATAQLAHRGIVRVFDLVELDPAKGSLVLVMELLRGHTLAERLETLGKLTVQQTMDVVLPILSALAHAHGVGVVHRDLKPENIMLAVEPDGQVLPKLLDFGISKMRHGAMAITGDGELVGTPCYMSPEQALGRDVDPRSDVFAVGILLYECLSGRNPFLADGLHLVVRAVLEEDPEPIADIPPALWSVIARAMAKRMEQRFPSAAALADALRAAVATVGPDATIPPATVSSGSIPNVTASLVHPRPLAPVPPATPRSRGIAAGIAACVAVISLASAAASFGASHHAAAARPARVAQHATKHVVVESSRIVAAASPEEAAVVPATTASASPAPIHRHRVFVMRDPGF